MRCASRRGEALALLNWDPSAHGQHQLAPVMTMLAVFAAIERLHRLLQRVGTVDRHIELPSVDRVSHPPQQVGVWLQDDVGRLDASLGHLRSVGRVDSRPEPIAWFQHLTDLPRLARSLTTSMTASMPPRMKRTGQDKEVSGGVVDRLVGPQTGAI